MRETLSEPIHSAVLFVEYRVDFGHCDGTEDVGLRELEHLGVQYLKRLRTLAVGRVDHRRHEPDQVIPIPGRSGRIIVALAFVTSPESR
jgi:hypothetical protein